MRLPWFLALRLILTVQPLRIVLERPPEIVLFPPRRHVVQIRPEDDCVGLCEFRIRARILHEPSVGRKKRKKKIKNIKNVIYGPFPL